MRREERRGFFGTPAALLFLRRWRICCSQEAGPAVLQGGRKAKGLVFPSLSSLSPSQERICLNVRRGGPGSSKAQHVGVTRLVSPDRA